MIAFLYHKVTVYYTRHAYVGEFFSDPDNISKCLSFIFILIQCGEECLPHHYPDKVASIQSAKGHTPGILSKEDNVIYLKQAKDCSEKNKTESKL